MTDTPTTLLVLDGTGAQVRLNAVQTAANTITPLSQPQIGGAEVTNANPLPCLNAASAYVDHSGTIAVGGTAQQLMAANANRRGWVIKNTSVANLYVNETGATAVVGNPSWTVIPGDTFPLSQPTNAPSGAISIIGPNTSQSFLAREW